MASYVAKRLAYAVPVVILVSIMTFSLLHLSGGDPAAMMLGEGADPVVIARVRTDLGLDKPLYEQYWAWLSKAATGDLGRSILPSRLRVGDAIAQRAPVTLELGLLAIALSLMVGIPIGILAGVRPGSRFDVIASNIAVLGIAIPNFLLALLLILVVSLWLRWLPPSGYTPPAQDLGQNLRQMVLPAITIGAFLLAFIVRITRVSVLEVMQREYITTARAKGLSGRGVVLRHALRPALMPVVTIVGLQLGAVLGGSIIIEAIFALPGLGKLTIDSIYSRDFPMLQGALLVLSIGFVVVNIAVDVAYAYLDPRIRMASPVVVEVLPRQIGGRSEALRPLHGVFAAFRRSSSLAIGGAIVLVISLLALFAPLLSPTNPIEMNLNAVLQPPSFAHPLGTDDLGRDVWTRTLYGGRISLLVGVLAVAFSTAIGTTLGLISGHWGGQIDNVIMRLLDAILAIPALLLAVGIAAALGPKLENVIIAVGLVYIPAFARLVRAQVLVIRQEDYVTAARLTGASGARILRAHLLPNVRTAIIVLASLRVSSAILAEASLSFLGLGAQPPTPTWGSMVNTGQRYLENAPWIAFGPGAAILLCILGLSILGEGARQVLDPRFQSQTGIGR